MPYLGKFPFGSGRQSLLVFSLLLCGRTPPRSTTYPQFLLLAAAHGIVTPVMAIFGTWTGGRGRGPAGRQTIDLFLFFPLGFKIWTHHYFEGFLSVVDSSSSRHYIFFAIGDHHFPDTTSQYFPASFKSRHFLALDDTSSLVNPRAFLLQPPTLLLSLPGSDPPPPSTTFRAALFVFPRSVFG